jgi:peptidoglycan hydrolase CwlO-like protein
MLTVQFDSVKSLSNVLRDVDDVQSQRDLTSQQKQTLNETAQGCRNILEQLNKTLDKYQELDSSAKGISGKSRKVWKRLQWDQKDIDQFRSRITLNISAFGTFLGQITR